MHMGQPLSKGWRIQKENKIWTNQVGCHVPEWEPFSMGVWYRVDKIGDEDLYPPVFLQKLPVGHILACK